MKMWPAAVGAMLLSVVAARADDLQVAHAAVTAMLQKDGGGLVGFLAACPKKNADPWQYVGSTTIVAVDEADRGVLVNTGYCNGGNGAGQYLVIIQNGAAHIVSDIGIKDMSFLADNMYAEDGSLVLYGNHWLDNDPHCCPSKKATLEYNIKTHQHKLTIVGDNKS
jgi:hypothetical protein